MVQALIEEGRLLVEEGIEARLAAADKEAAITAQQDVESLLKIQGDVNNSDSKTKSIVEIMSKEDIEN